MKVISSSIKVVGNCIKSLHQHKTVKTARGSTKFNVGSIKAICLELGIRVTAVVYSIKSVENSTSVVTRYQMTEPRKCHVQLMSLGVRMEVTLKYL